MHDIENDSCDNPLLGPYDGGDCEEGDEDENSRQAQLDFVLVGQTTDCVTEDGSGLYELPTGLAEAGISNNLHTTSTNDGLVGSNEIPLSYPTIRDQITKIGSSLSEDEENVHFSLRQNVENLEKAIPLARNKEFGSHSFYSLEDFKRLSTTFSLSSASDANDYDDECYAIGRGSQTFGGSLKSIPTRDHAEVMSEGVSLTSMVNTF